MLNSLVDTRDLKFVLFEVLKIQSLAQYKDFSDYDMESIEALIDLVEKISVNEFQKTFEAADREACTWDPVTKKVTAPQSLKPALDTYYEAGLMSLLMLESADGSQLPPRSAGAASLEYICAAAPNLMMYTILSAGVINLIKEFGTEEQQKLYLPGLISGQWGGTMCLTEADAGSDVGNLKAKAVKQDDGTYLITGQKIFISSGDNDLYSNMIHPVLARIEGDPAGTKGISIFLVPKYLIKEDGSNGDFNDVICAGIEHKLGIKGSATCTMVFGENNNCRGYLLGSERKGMKIMFQMMNTIRLGTALQAQGTSSAAYLNAVTYAKNRIQGSHVLNAMNPEAPKTEIINHPDVSRMLLWMKSYVDAQRIMINYNYFNQDLAKVLDGEERENAESVIELLVPLCKAGCSDTSILITSEAMQVFGGYGFCMDYPVEQFYRNCRILSIFEGANGIQAIDLIMRKILLNKDQKGYKTWKGVVEKTLDKAQDIVTDKYINHVRDGIENLDMVINKMKKRMEEGRILEIFTHATPFLRGFYILVLAWCHIWSMTEAIPCLEKIQKKNEGMDIKSLCSSDSESAFYAGRIQSGKFFIESQLPLFFAIAESIMNADSAALSVLPEMFTGAPEE
ncbi:MAG: acyl-CoA dehydrogenase [Spirochaetota bacterium]